MAIVINQLPATASLAQSPIAFSVSESAGLYSQLGFVYTANLYYWTGSISNSGSYDYQLQKFPNASNFGIFDLSKIIASTFNNNAYANPSDVRYFKCDFNFQYQSGSNYVTGSTVTSSVFYALDGYLLSRNNAIGTELNQNTVFYPFLTDGPQSQSATLDDWGSIGIWKVPVLGGTAPTTASVTASYSNGTTASYAFPLTAVGSGNPTTNLIQLIPFGPQEIADNTTSSFNSSLLKSYKLQAYAGGTALGSPLHVDIFCEAKYTPIRIQYKNRYGQWDWFTFPKVNRRGFKTKSRDYRPQVGSWNASSLVYNDYDSTIQKYVVDTDETLLVNSDWLPETYNNAFKQLLVSPEIYQVEDNGNLLTPLSITTSDFQIKTVVNDQLIQYAFEFAVGESYKLVL